MKNKKTWIMLAAGAGIAGLTYALWPKKKIPQSAIFQPFDSARYMGVWHEIARLPNQIERNLRDLTEEYSANADGSINVITKAYNFDKNKPVEATGTAKFTGSKTRGQLKVAYYIPIYLDYNILDIDASYQYAMVSGSGSDHLWFLSRENDIPGDIRQRFLDKALLLGFDIGKLEWMDATN